MRKLVGYRTLKTALGAAIAIYLAQFLGLAYATSAGIITVLSVQNTKRKSIELALRRIASTALGLSIATALFQLLGFTPLAFGFVLLLFIPSAARLRLQDGIVMSAVLITHLLIEESTALVWIMNEFGLVVVGAGVALLMNLYMPSIEKDIRRDQRKVEERMKTILLHLAEALRTQAVPVMEETLYRDLKAALDTGYERAMNLSSNYLTRDFRYYVRYMEMRIKQFEILRHMRGYLGRIDGHYAQSKMVAAFTELVSDQFSEINTAKELLEDLSVYEEMFRQQPLPVTRVEFENRAALYQYFQDLRNLLELKKDFAQGLTAEERVRFWEASSPADAAP